MKIACISLEGVLTPHIWEEVAKIVGIPEFIEEDGISLDYPSVMRRRIATLRRHGVTYGDIQFIVSMLKCSRGASSLIRALRKEHYIIVLADTFQEIAVQFTKHLGHPVLKSHQACADEHGYLKDDFNLNYQKHAVVDLYNKLGHQTLAIGHSLHDLTMIRKATAGCLYRPTGETRLLGWDLPMFYELRDISSYVVARRAPRRSPQDGTSDQSRF